MQATSTDKLREAQNHYYWTIRHTKQACWETFLIGPSNIGEQPSPQDTTWCWQMLGFTKPSSATTIPTLHGPQKQVVSSITEKKALIHKVMFPLTLREDQETDIAQGTWHTQIDEERVKQALFHQMVQKAPEINKLNFQALQLLWEWDSPWIVTLAW